MAKCLRLVGLSLVALAVALPAAAQGQGSGRVEIGASLVNVMVVIPQGGDRSLLFGVPSGFGLLSPSVYATVLMAPRLGIEPQVGLLVISSGGATSHTLNVAGQVDYFLSGIASASSPYVFGAVGLNTVSGSDTTPKQFSGGAGYRIRFGDRLVLRIDGRYTHFSDGAGDGVGFNFSIGGIFGT